LLLLSIIRYQATLTDRFGASHMGARTQGNDPKTRVGVKLVTGIVSAGDAAEQEEDARRAAAEERKKGRAAPPRTAAEAVKLAHAAMASKSGGVFSHFFHGLNPTMKRMVRTRLRTRSLARD